MAMMEERETGADTRLRRVERHVKLVGEGVPLTTIQEGVGGVEASLKEVARDVVHLKADLASHEHAECAELAAVEATQR